MTPPPCYHSALVAEARKIAIDSSTDAWVNLRCSVSTLANSALSASSCAAARAAMRCFLAAAEGAAPARKAASAAARLALRRSAWLAKRDSCFVDSFLATRGRCPDCWAAAAAWAPAASILGAWGKHTVSFRWGGAATAVEVHVLLGALVHEEHAKKRQWQELGG